MIEIISSLLLSVISGVTSGLFLQFKKKCHKEIQHETVKFIKTINFDIGESWNNKNIQYPTFKDTILLLLLKMFDKQEAYTNLIHILSFFAIRDELQPLWCSDVKDPLIDCCITSEFVGFLDAINSLPTDNLVFSKGIPVHFNDINTCNQFKFGYIILLASPDFDRVKELLLTTECEFKLFNTPCANRNGLSRDELINILKTDPTTTLFNYPQNNNRKASNIVTKILRYYICNLFKKE